MRDPCRKGTDYLTNLKIKKKITQVQMSNLHRKDYELIISEAQKNLTNADLQMVIFRRPNISFKN